MFVKREIIFIRIKAESFCSLPCVHFKPFHWLSLPSIRLFVLSTPHIPYYLLVFQRWMYTKKVDKYESNYFSKETVCEFFKFVFWNITMFCRHTASQRLIYLARPPLHTHIKAALWV